MSRFSKILKASLESDDAAKVDDAPITPDVTATPATTTPEAGDGVPAATAAAPDPVTEAKVDSNIEPGSTEVVEAGVKPDTAAVEDGGEDPAAAAAAADAVPAAAPTDPAAEPAAAPAADPAAPAEPAAPAAEPAPEPVATDLAPVEVTEVAEIAPAIVIDDTLPAEIVESEDNVEKANDAVDTFASVSAGLADVQELLEESLPEGGIAPQTAQMLEVNLSVQRERLGDDGGVIPSVEHFGGESSRYTSTVASLESVKDFAKRASTAIKAALQKLREFLAQMLGKLLAYAGSLNQRNKELEKRAAGAAGKAAKNGKVKLGATAERIAVGETIALRDFTLLPALIDDALKYDADFDNMLTKDYQAIVAFAGKVVEADSNDRFAEMFGTDLSLSALPAVPKAFRHHNTTSSSESYETDTLPGNVVLAFVHQRQESGESTYQKLLRKFSATWKIERQEKEVKLAEDFEASTLSLADIAAVIKTVASLQVAAARVDALKSAPKLLFSEVRFADGMSDKQAAFVQNLMTRFTQRLSQAHQASAKLLAYTLRVASNYQTYAFKSVAEYGSAE